MKTLNARALRKLTLISAMALAAGWGSQLQAGTDTANLSAQATVTANCTIETNIVNFGNYDPIVDHASSNLDSTGSVSVTCTSGSAVAITLGQGLNADTGSTDAAPLRRLNDGSTNYLSYSLYSDAGYSTVWGNDATVDVETTGTGGIDAHNVYGRITAGQNVPAGTYTDTVVATVTF